MGKRSDQMWKWVGRKRWWFFWGMTVAALPLALWILPGRLAKAHDISEVERLAAENAVRGTLLQAIGGAFLLGGLYVTWRTFDLNRQGHVTDRFTKAIDQLGSDRPDVQLGGIYALERIARDSEPDHSPIVEVLTAFVRLHAPWSAVGPQVGASTAGGKLRPAPQVQAALTVLGRRHVHQDEPGLKLRLSGLDLRGVSLRGGHFEQARLRGTHLEGAYLEGAQLQGAKLRGAQLQNADFESDPDPDLTLPAANLEGASLEGANLSGAKMRGANLSGANMRSVILSGAEIEGANLSRIAYDETTVWPQGFEVEELMMS